MPARSTSALLPPELLARAERLRISPRSRRTNRTQGEHHHGKGGSSTEFSDYRSYVPGDDTRHVDWNIFSRLGEPYLKLYQHEEEMQVVLILDASASMDFSGKFDLARQLAGALGIAGLMGREKVSAYCIGPPDAAAGPDAAATLHRMPPSVGRVSRGKLAAYLDEAKPGGAVTIETLVDRVLRRHRGKGVAVLISDFLSPARADNSSIETALNRLHAAGLEPQAIQVLAPEELDPDVVDDVRFVDIETQRVLDVSAMKDLLALYHEQRLDLEDRLAAACRRRGGRFASVRSDATPLSIVNDVFVRGGWLR